MSIMPASASTVQPPRLTLSSLDFRTFLHEQAETLAELDPIDEYRPSLDEGYNPSVNDEIEWLGYSLRLAGEPMAEIDTENTTFLLAFAAGQCRGLEARLAEEAEQRAYDRWVDERARDAFDPTAGIHDAEIRGIC